MTMDMDSGDKRPAEGLRDGGRFGGEGGFEVESVGPFSNFFLCPSVGKKQRGVVFFPQTHKAWDFDDL